MKIRNKIVLLFTILVTVIISFLAFSVYYFSSLERKTVFYKRLKSRALYSAQIYALFGDSSNVVLNRVDSVNSNGSLSDKNIVIFPIDENSKFEFDVMNENHLLITQDILESAIAAGEVDFTTGNRDAIALKYRSNLKTFIVVVAADDMEGKLRLNELVKILFVNWLIGVCMTALAGFLFSKRILKPISQIIYEVGEISAHNLSRRLNSNTGKDELSSLASAFNGLLERIHKSFDLQKQFISNASHELSTPLTSISSQLEVTLQKERSIFDYQKVLHSIHEDVLQMRLLTRSLLEIAKAEMQGNIELSEVRLDEILLRITSEVKHINKNYTVDLYFGEFPEDEMDCVVFGNMELLHSALKNIIENGCKYSDDKISSIALSFQNHHAYVSVKNKGNPISMADINKLFQPFYRGNNSKHLKGFGLGLALAKGIIHLHKGKIDVHSNVLDGTMFMIDIPSCKSIQLQT